MARTAAFALTKAMGQAAAGLPALSWGLRGRHPSGLGGHGRPDPALPQRRPAQLHARHSPADIDRASSVSAYSRLLRTAFSVVIGRANPDWDAIRNPKGSESSMRFYAGPQAVASSTASSVLHGSRSPMVHDPKRVAAPGGDQARFRP